MSKEQILEITNAVAQVLQRASTLSSGRGKQAIEELKKTMKADPAHAQALKNLSVTIEPVEKACKAQRAGLVKLLQLGGAVKAGTIPVDKATPVVNKAVAEAHKLHDGASKCHAAYVALPPAIKSKAMHPKAFDAGVADFLSAWDGEKDKLRPVRPAAAAPR